MHARVFATVADVGVAVSRLAGVGDRRCASSRCTLVGR